MLYVGALDCADGVVLIGTSEIFFLSTYNSSIISPTKVDSRFTEQRNVLVYVDPVQFKLMITKKINQGK